MGSKLTRYAGVITFFIVLTWVVTGKQVEASTFGDSGSNLSNYRYMLCYTVKAGDTLYDIARAYKVPLAKLMDTNNLKDTIIRPGDVLLVPDRINDHIPSTLSRGGISREELMLLARLIHAEARGESFTGQVAVGAVILNRVASPGFPKTIREVIFQKEKNVFQFSPVEDGSIYLEPDETAINAALEALTGRDPTNGALFFYNPRTATDRWIRTLPVVTRIGNHVFATKV
ncbi:cell wall hydrolase [Desulfofundulus sp.]|uniref:cell wall hydrolase n=1 Tax=Desulfofundulus sp. TaxID=2282750 RepID=UPI003C7371B7